MANPSSENPDNKNTTGDTHVEDANASAENEKKAIMAKPYSKLDIHSSYRNMLCCIAVAYLFYIFQTYWLTYLAYQHMGPFGSWDTISESWHWRDKLVQNPMYYAFLALFFFADVVGKYCWYRPLVLQRDWFKVPILQELGVYLVFGVVIYLLPGIQYPLMSYDNKIHEVLFVPILLGFQIWKVRKYDIDEIAEKRANDNQIDEGQYSLSQSYLTLYQNQNNYQQNQNQNSSNKKIFTLSTRGFAFFFAQQFRTMVHSFMWQNGMNQKTLLGLQAHNPQIPEVVWQTWIWMSFSGVWYPLFLRVFVFLDFGVLRGSWWQSYETTVGYKYKGAEYLRGLCYLQIFYSVFRSLVSTCMLVVSPLATCFIMTIKDFWNFTAHMTLRVDRRYFLLKMQPSASPSCKRGIQGAQSVLKEYYGFKSQVERKTSNTDIGEENKSVRTLLQQLGGFRAGSELWLLDEDLARNTKKQKSPFEYMDTYIVDNIPRFFRINNFLTIESHFHHLAQAYYSQSQNENEYKEDASIIKGWRLRGQDPPWLLQWKAQQQQDDDWGTDDWNSWEQAENDQYQQQIKLWNEYYLQNDNGTKIERLYDNDYKHSEQEYNEDGSRIQFQASDWLANLQKEGKFEDKLLTVEGQWKKNHNQIPFLLQDMDCYMQIIGSELIRVQHLPRIAGLDQNGYASYQLWAKQYNFLVRKNVALGNGKEKEKENQTNQQEQRNLWGELLWQYVFQVNAEDESMNCAAANCNSNSMNGAEGISMDWKDFQQQLVDKDKDGKLKNKQNKEIKDINIEEDTKDDKEKNNENNSYEQEHQYFENIDYSHKFWLFTDPTKQVITPAMCAQLEPLITLLQAHSQRQFNCRIMPRAATIFFVLVVYQVVVQQIIFSQFGNFGNRWKTYNPPGTYVYSDPGMFMGENIMTQNERNLLGPLDLSFGLGLFVLPRGGGGVNFSFDLPISGRNFRSYNSFRFVLASFLMLGECIYEVVFGYWYRYSQCIGVKKMPFVNCFINVIITGSGFDLDFFDHHKKTKNRNKNSNNQNSSSSSSTQRQSRSYQIQNQKSSISFFKLGYLFIALNLFRMLSYFMVDLWPEPRAILVYEGVNETDPPKYAKNEKGQHSIMEMINHLYRPHLCAFIGVPYNNLKVGGIINVSDYVPFENGNGFCDVRLGTWRDFYPERFDGFDY